MDKDAEKRYRELSPKEKYDSAIRAREEPYDQLEKNLTILYRQLKI